MYNYLRASWFNGCKQDSQNRLGLPIAKYHVSHICMLVSDCFVYNVIKLDDWCIKQTQRGLETEITDLGEQTTTIQHKMEECRYQDMIHWN